ncbi:hypothetical protein XI06_15275 [Bradyrhizobium sp. CCBAU 11434]|uniref:hypothetical protein n=1 Tax=Bradyrhizobium sp. CCBAU 11434 TaxID=1630885 RepID=UPI0023066D1F|nr:hypothetical protein [Bradyrhizobium sp. CCBAU 11434]MDA9521665.1 hypothetical protein [Bradyrhizobium sp. CCBAU 11434]
MAQADSRIIGSGTAASDKTVADVFAVFGGPAAFARTFGLKNPSTASEMKRRESISVGLWPAIVAEGAALNVEWLTYECLTLMHAKTSLLAGEIR